MALLDVVMVMPGMFSASPRVVVANVAVTLVLSVRLTTQVPVPEQPPPDQPVKMEPELVSPAAVKVMDVGARKEAEQVLPQEIPAGAEVTVPLPVRFGNRQGVRGVAAVVQPRSSSRPNVTTPGS